MSIKLSGQFGQHRKSNLTSQISGEPPEYGIVSVEIQGDINRDTKASLIKKYLKNGWDWNKFVPISVAVFPEELDLPDRLLDGDHRRHMFKLCFQNAMEIPALFYKLGSLEEYHKLFTEINHHNRKSATKEEVFVHEWYAGDQKAKEVVKHLIACGVCVYGSMDPGGVIGLAGSPVVKVGGFKRALKRGPKNVKMAAALIKRTWSQDLDYIPAELLEGLALLFELYPSLSSSRSVISADFERWFTSSQAYCDHKTCATDMKTLGGNVVNKASASIALGIAKRYRNSSSRHPQAASAVNKKRAMKLCLIQELLD
mgnify:CR=1 FL=1